MRWIELVDEGQLAPDNTTMESLLRQAGTCSESILAQLPPFTPEPEQEETQTPAADSSALEEATPRRTLLGVIKGALLTPLHFAHTAAACTLAAPDAISAATYSAVNSAIVATMVGTENVLAALASVRAAVAEMTSALAELSFLDIKAVCGAIVVAAASAVPRPVVAIAKRVSVWTTKVACRSRLAIKVLCGLCMVCTV